MRDFLLNDLADLDLVHCVVVALNNFTERGHLFHLQPLWDQRGQLFNQAETLLSVHKLASLLVTELLEQYVHLQSSCPPHLHNVSNLACQVGQCLLALLVGLLTHHYLSFLFFLNHFVFHLLDHA